MACLHLCRASIDCAIYVDTGKSYPETLAMVEYASSIVPVCIVKSNQQEQNELEGIPADVVPVNYTRFGQAIAGYKNIRIQGYLECCFQNIGLPLFLKARELGATEMIYGQRLDDQFKATSRNGDVIDGITRLHPIEKWTSEDVLSYLRTVMDVPEHYYFEHSSLDCYDCTAFTKHTQDRVEFTRNRYPEFHRQYHARMNLVRQALLESGYVEK